MPDNKADSSDEAPRSHGFWSGTLAFGLVSVPVSLFSANRPGRASLRMVDADGTPLMRRYFCSKDERVLENDEIVRGYEVEKGRFVLVEDEELETLEPKKSQEIDLQKFVSLSAVDPALFERAYFLAPGKGGARPYRLLAKAMEDAGRAGIATFVMRGKEYLVAIIADNGMLRAEILRFHDELRSPADVGLPDLAKPDGKEVRAIEKAIRKLHKNKPDRKALSDQYTERLLALVKRKLDRNESVYEAPEEAEPSEQESAEIIDLMQVLKQRMREKAGPTGKAAKAKKAGSKEARLEERSRSELYDRAKTLDIEGRSGMNKDQLIDAIRAAR